MLFEGFPIVVGFELTLACNLQCRHCASSATERSRKNELATKEILNICDQFTDLFVQEVDLTGGEPLLRPDWSIIIEHIRKHNIPVRMVTNGILLKENARKMADAGLTTVGISLDGLEETHDHIRKRPGLFKRIVSGIETALHEGIPVAVITAVNDMNIKELPSLHAFLQTLGIEHWQVQPTFSIGRARSCNISLSNPTYIEMGEFISAHRMHCDGGEIGIVPADGVGYFTKLDSREHPWKGCSAGISSCGITSDGHVKGCLSLPDTFNEGNLREKELWHIWFEENAFAYTRKFTTNDLNDNCRDCSYGYQCKGGCSVMSYSATGELHNNPYCFHRLLNNGDVTNPTAALSADTP